MNLPEECYSSVLFCHPLIYFIYRKLRKRWTVQLIIQFVNWTFTFTLNNSFCHISWHIQIMLIVMESNLRLSRNRTDFILSGAYFSNIRRKKSLSINGYIDMFFTARAWYDLASKLILIDKSIYQSKNKRRQKLYI